MMPMPDIRQSAVAQRIIAESRALRAAMAMTGEAVQLIRDVCQEPRDGIEGALTTWAMEKILGELRLPESFVFRKGPGREFFSYVAYAWGCWATGDVANARVWLKMADRLPEASGEALHMMALNPWKSAVEALVEGNQDEAMRLYRRAMEIGSQVGTPTNTAIQWTYAASFFEHERTSGPRGAV